MRAHGTPFAGETRAAWRPLFPRRYPLYISCVRARRTGSTRIDPALATQAIAPQHSVFRPQRRAGAVHFRRRMRIRASSSGAAIDFRKDASVWEVAGMRNGR